VRVGVERPLLSQGWDPLAHRRRGKWNKAISWGMERFGALPPLPKSCSEKSRLRPKIRHKAKALL